MVVLGGRAFLMNEVPLYTLCTKGGGGRCANRLSDRECVDWRLSFSKKADGCESSQADKVQTVHLPRLQGYLAHKKKHPPWDHRRALGIFPP